MASMVFVKDHVRSSKFEKVTAIPRIGDYVEAEFYFPHFMCEGSEQRTIGGRVRDVRFTFKQEASYSVTVYLEDEGVDDG